MAGELFLNVCERMGVNTVKKNRLAYRRQNKKKSEQDGRERGTEPRHNGVFELRFL